MSGGNSQTSSDAIPDSPQTQLPGLERRKLLQPPIGKGRCLRLSQVVFAEGAGALKPDDSEGLRRIKECSEPAGHRKPVFLYSQTPADTTASR